MSTRRHGEQALKVEDPRRPGALPKGGEGDLAETVALVARSRRELLLAVHRHRLGREELEDCYSQATFELLARARRRCAGGLGEPFSSSAHIANALEQRLLSRIHDRRRAIGGRSPIEAALAKSVPLSENDGACAQLADERADVERIAALRHDLRRIAEISRELTRDQRLVLVSQLSCEQGASEFCTAHGWSLEKYRKVAQRARARLTRLLALDAGVPAVAGCRISEQGLVYDHHSPTT